MGKKSIVFIFLFWVTLFIAQDHPETMKSSGQFNEKVLDTNTANYFNQLAEKYAFSHPDSTEYYAKKGLLISEKLGFEKGVFNAYSQRGVAKVYSNNLKEAESFFLKALTSAEKIPLIYDEAVTLRILGNITFTLGEYPRALDFFERGSVLAIKHQLEYLIPEFYHNIGYVYFETKDFVRALQYLELCHRATEEYQVIDLYPNSLFNMAKITMHKKEYKRAREYAKSILGMLDTIPNAINFVPAAYEYIGESYYMEQSYDSALFYYKKMLFSLEGLDEMYMGPKMIEEILAYRGIGKSQVALKRFDAAETNLLKAFTLSDEAHNLEDKSEVALALSEVYEKTGNLSKSLAYYKTYNSTTDSLISEKKISELTQVRMEYEFAEQQKIEELEQAKKDQEHIKNELRYIVVLVGVVIILIFFISLYRAQRNKARQEKLIKKNLQLNLDFKNQELTSNVLYMLKKNELLLAISDKLKKAKRKSKTSNRPLIDEMIKEIEISSKEIGWEEFELLFKEIHADFYRRLIEKFPTLTSNEKRLCAFLKLNMSSKEISSLTFQSYHSIIQARSRMRKKMGIEDNESLILFINQL